MPENGDLIDISALNREIASITGVGCADHISRLNHSIESLTFVDYALLEQDEFGSEHDRILVMHLVRKFIQDNGSSMLNRYKLFNDPVYGSIKVHPLALLLIDTPQFQRLRHIAQLASLGYVYPGGSYNRFEHSLGVYHLAEKLVYLLKDKQPELKITCVDAMCVQLAGLCHDLGHGPFSHLFDRRVIPVLLPNTTWTHERASTDMLDYLFSKPHVQEGFRLWGFSERDLEFIKSLIICKPNEKLTGRGGSKLFLYEIVANGRNGMDVDKWDYFARDSLHLGIKNSFEHDRLMHHLRVINVEGRPEICVRDKEVDTVYNMFYTRYDLHKKAYQHPVGRGIEMMISEAIVKAAPYLRFAGKTLEESLKDMEAYTKVNDSIFYKILDSEGEEMRESRELLERIERRQIWKCVGQSRVDFGECNLKQLESELAEATQTGIRVVWCTKDFGKQRENPLDYIRFYDKNNPTVASRLTDKQKSLMLPQQFHHLVVSVFCTATDIPHGIYTTVEQLFKEKGFHMSLSHD